MDCYVLLREGKRYTVCNGSEKSLVPLENYGQCICVAFCIFVCVWPHTRRIQSVSVLSEYDYLVVSAMD